jgi:hypothetical protein
MVWIVLGSLVAVVLVAAWLYDRRWGVNDSAMPGPQQRADMEFEAWRGQQQMGPYDGL